MNGDQTGHPSVFVNTTGFQYYFNYLQDAMPPELHNYNNYVQLSAVRKAIHVGSMKWNNGDRVKMKFAAILWCQQFHSLYCLLYSWLLPSHTVSLNTTFQVEKELLNDFMQSVKPWIEELLEHYK